jgi:hypothetical protein
MRLRTKIGAAMAAVTLTGVVTTGLLTSLRVTRTIHEEADRRLLESTSALGGEWGALGGSVSSALAEVAGRASLRAELGKLARGVVPAASPEIINLARILKAGTDVSKIQACTQ